MKMCGYTYKSYITVCCCCSKILSKFKISTILQKFFFIFCVIGVNRTYFQLFFSFIKFVKCLKPIDPDPNIDTFI